MQDTTASPPLQQQKQQSAAATPAGSASSLSWFFGLDQLTVLCVLYFLSSCIQAFPASTWYIFLIRDLHVDPSDLYDAGAIAFLPWNLRIVYGIIADAVPIAGSRRKVYLFVFSALSALVFIAIANLVKSFSVYLAFQVILSLFVAWNEVILDSISVQIALSNYEAKKSTEELHTEQQLPGILDPGSPLQQPREDPAAASATASPAKKGGGGGELLGDPLLAGTIDVSPKHRSSFVQMETELLNNPIYRDVSSEIQSKCMFYRSFGSLAASLLNILASKYLATSTIISISSVFPICFFLISFLVHEDRNFRRFKFTSSNIRSAFSFFATLARRWWLPMLFIFIVDALPSSTESFQSFILATYTDITPWMNSLFMTLSLLGSLLGVALYWRVCKKFSLKSMFLVSTIVASLSGITPIILALKANESLGISVPIFVAIDDLVVSACSRLAFMPILILAAQNCPKNMEAAVFSMFLSVNDLGALASGFIGGRLSKAFGLTYTSYGNLWLFIVVCNVARLFPLAFVPFL